MRLSGPDWVLLVFVLFCRIGGCLMLMPGFSSPRVPVQVRLLIAVAVTLSLAPLLLPALAAAVARPPTGAVIVLIVAETLTGVFIGLMGRIFFLALQFMAVALASFIGTGSLPGLPIDDGEPNAAVSSLITLTATVLFFTADLHWDVLRGLVQSYAVLPVTGPMAADLALARLADATSDAFILAVQIGSPFFVYALVVNLMFGMVNKLIPQIPVYFISLPFVLAGGMLLLYFAIGEFLSLFLDGFAGWQARG
ncbi:MAG: flagellar biosynthesis protein FliR [Hyphomicrobiaceae bacterium]|nr:flagellar biosynthesis protein FliR [Hyphomicrobiaceae bacterium]